MRERHGYKHYYREGITTREGMKRKKEKKRILTALNQASRKRFTFEYGSCASKGKGGCVKKEKKPGKKGDKGTVTGNRGIWQVRKKRRNSGGRSSDKGVNLSHAPIITTSWWVALQ